MVKCKKRFITLIEIMIVMFLIALITGVLAYNYRGSLEQGKVFKTKAAIERIETILNLAIAESPELKEEIEQKWKDVISNSPMVKNPKDLQVDGWGKEYKVELNNEGILEVKSEGLEEYEKGKK